MSEDNCLDLIFGAKSGDSRYCPKCKGQRRFYRVKGRKCYECGKCGHQHYPLVGTIMEGSRTCLTKWFIAFERFVLSKNGLSANELARTIEVTYKCAWRMLNLIRNSLKEGEQNPFQGTFEVDETYIGGKGKNTKACIIGVKHRGGNVTSTYVKRRTKPQIYGLIKEQAAKGSTIYTDEHSLYTKLKKEGYKHDWIRHKQWQWQRGKVSTNSIEAYWSLLKRNLRCTHVSVSIRWMQSYLDAYDFIYNRRREESIDILEEIVVKMLFNA